MIISFSIQNYRSIKDLATIDLTEVGRLREDIYAPEAPQVGQRILPVLAIYGPNASGKSNLIRGLTHIISGLIMSAERGPTSGIPHHPFRLTKNVDPVSRFSITFTIKDDVYCFEVSHDAKHVYYERLRQRGERGWRLLYERNLQEFKFGKTLPGRNIFMSEITRPNSFFLSVAASNNHPVLSSIFAGITENVEIRDHPSWPSSAEYIQSNEHIAANVRTKVVNFLKSADLGILDFTLRKNKLSDKEVERIQRVLRAARDPDDHESEQIDLDEIYSDRYEEDFMMAGEGGVSIAIPKYDQSTGTQLLWDMAGGILNALHTGGAIIVDELEKSLHPVVAQRIVEQFINPETNPNGAQLIFTSHSLSVLNTIGLPRSSIWFCEKDHEGHSVFYPLSDFNTRARDDIAKGYIQGRFGAIPFIGQLSDG